MQNTKSECSRQFTVFIKFLHAARKNFRAHFQILRAINILSLGNLFIHGFSIVPFERFQMQHIFLIR